jgi:c-di-GMP-binding flagellar brake protein YcgR
MPDYSGVEKRRYKRVRVGVTVIYRKNRAPNVSICDEKGENDAVMLDISEGGMAIVTAVNVPVDTELWIKFTLSETDGKSVGFYGNMELLGKVNSNIVLGKDSYRLGIAFLEMEGRIRRNIANFVNVVEAHSHLKKL